MTKASKYQNEANDAPRRHVARKKPTPAVVRAPDTMTAEEYNARSTKKGNKYGAIPTVVDGVTFASKAEARHYRVLRLREQAGEITALELQPRYPLVVNGLLVATYVADMRYRERDGSLVVCDVKGGAATITAVFRLKSKLMRALYDIDVLIVQA